MPLKSSAVDGIAALDGCAEAALVFASMRVLSWIAVGFIIYLGCDHLFGKTPRWRPNC